MYTDGNHVEEAEWRNGCSWALSDTESAKCSDLEKLERVEG
jgi:hypothetical protein